MLTGKIELIDKTVFNLLATGSLVNDGKSPSVGGHLKSIGVMDSNDKILEEFEVKVLANGSMVILKEGTLLGSALADAPASTLTLDLLESYPEHYLQLQVA